MKQAAVDVTERRRSVLGFLDDWIDELAAEEHYTEAVLRELRYRLGRARNVARDIRRFPDDPAKVEEAALFLAKFWGLDYDESVLDA